MKKALIILITAILVGIVFMGITTVSVQMMYEQDSLLNKKPMTGDTETDTAETQRRLDEQTTAFAERHLYSTVAGGIGVAFGLLLGVWVEKKFAARIRRHRTSKYPTVQEWIPVSPKQEKIVKSVPSRVIDTKAESK